MIDLEKPPSTEVQLQIALEPVSAIENFDALAQEHWDDFDNPQPKFKKEILERASAVVARVNGVPVGYILFMVNQSPFYNALWCTVGMYFLQRAFRGMRIGNKMFDFLEQVAKNTGCSQIHSSYNLKQPLAEFYQKRGYTTTHHAVCKEV
jgi:GNAT superfamily N-acetyltransferase